MLKHMMLRKACSLFLITDTFAVIKNGSCEFQLSVFGLKQFRSATMIVMELR